jgi:hypothetical protein
MVPHASRLWSAGALAALIAACGGGGSSLDIEIARYDGKVSAAGTTGFTLTRVFRTAADDYVRTLDYIANATANGKDDSGNGITGYKWWNFAYPTLLIKRRERNRRDAFTMTSWAVQPRPAP